jgi:hypothetical protein
MYFSIIIFKLYYFIIYLIILQFFYPIESDAISCQKEKEQKEKIIKMDLKIKPNKKKVQHN